MYAEVTAGELKQRLAVYNLYDTMTDGEAVPKERTPPRKVSTTSADYETVADVLYSRFGEELIARLREANTQGLLRVPVAAGDQLDGVLPATTGADSEYITLGGDMPAAVAYSTFDRSQVVYGEAGTGAPIDRQQSSGSITSIC